MGQRGKPLPITVPGLLRNCGSFPFLDVAVRYRETNDPRILLELPVEERTIVEELLQEVKKAQ